MKIKVYCDCTVTIGSQPDGKSCRENCYNLELPEGLEVEALSEAIVKSLPKGSQFVTYEFNRYEVVG